MIASSGLVHNGRQQPKHTVVLRGIPESARKVPYLCRAQLNVTYGMYIGTWKESEMVSVGTIINSCTVGLKSRLCAYVSIMISIELMKWAIKKFTYPVHVLLYSTK